MMDLIWFLSIAGFIGYGVYRLAHNNSAIRESLRSVGKIARGSTAVRIALAGGGLVLAWLVLEALILSGPRIYDGPLVLGQSFPFEVVTAGDSYLFTIGRISGKRRGRSSDSKRARLQYTINGPDGSVALRRTDIVSKQIRRFEYQSNMRGTHVLHVSHATQDARRGLSWLQINHNDRSVLLSRFGHLWPIELGVWSPFYPGEQIPGHVVDWAEWAEQK